MQAQSLFLLNTHKGLRPNSESRLSQCPLLGGSNIHLRRRELPKQIQPHSFTIKEKHKKKKCKTFSGTQWFLSRDFLNICGPFHSAQGRPPGWFPADATGAPCQAPGRAQGKAPPGTAAPRVKPCPSSRPCWPAEKVEQALGCAQGSEEEALSSPEQ